MYFFDLEETISEYDAWSFIDDGPCSLCEHLSLRKHFYFEEGDASIFEVSKEPWPRRVGLPSMVSFLERP